MRRLSFCVLGWTPYKPGPSRQLGNNCISFSSSFFFSFLSKVMSSLTLFCLRSVAHGLRARRRRMYLLAYIGADEFKRCCGMERVTIAAQRQTVAVSNCCTAVNPDPPCTERSVRRWIPFSFADPGRDRACQSLCASFTLGFIEPKVKPFHALPKRWQLFGLYCH